MYKLYFIVVLHLKPEGYSFWWPLVGSWILHVVLCVLGFAGIGATQQPVFHEIFSVTYFSCTIEWWFLNSLYIVFLGQIIFLWILAYRVGRVIASFNEFYENLFTASLTTLNFVSVWAMTLSWFSYTVPGKIACFIVSVICKLDLSHHLGIHGMYLAPLMKPMFGL